VILLAALRTRVLFLGLSIVLALAGASAAQESPSSLLGGLGFTLDGGVGKNTVSFTKKGLLVPTPWGGFEATIVETPVDRMVRVPLSPNGEPAQGRLLPYVTAGSRLNVDGDSVLEQARATAFGDSGHGSNLKAGAGVIWQLDAKVELFGEYQFMRLHRDVEGRGALGPLGTSLDTTGFSLGLSVRY
jgi:hypothetical protein